MRYEYTVSFDDFLHSLRAWRGLSKVLLLGYLLNVWIVLGICLAAAAYCSFTLITHTAQDALMTSLIGVVALGLGTALVTSHSVRVRRAYKLRNTLTKGRPMFFEFDQGEARFIVPDGAEVSYPWSTFTNLVEDERVATLFIQRAAFHTIPKRAMADEQWSQLRAFVTPHLKSSN